MFRFLFGSSKTAKQEQAATQTTAPGTNIHYSAGLIEQLKRDHRNLLSLYTLIFELVGSEDYDLAELRLADFRNLLQHHLLTEKIKLYIYMEHLWPRESDQFVTMHNYRQEMEGIGKVVVGFLRKYESFSQDPALIATFKDDLNQIGQVLVRRIKEEESNLYPLYRKS